MCVLKDTDILFLVISDIYKCLFLYSKGEQFLKTDPEEKFVLWSVMKMPTKSGHLLSS